MATSRRRTTVEPSLKVNMRCPRDREINILLLGQTGVGKTTFINAFANYVVNDTLREAERDEMQVVILASFSHTVGDNFQEKLIVIGKENESEQQKNYGQSNTQQCRSFVFPIGDRNLRFIDTPGVGDTNGLLQDEKNFQDILDYISQFEHLNAVFILLKPNEERLTIFFKYCVNELLRHLHTEASSNIVFIFTNAQSTFFKPGSTTANLRTLLGEHHTKHNVDVPFSTKNTFMFDSESFRYLALLKNGVRLDNEQAQSCVTSWDNSVREYSRLMKHVIKCPLHGMSGVLSLNEAEQLVRKLPRPIAETARLIEENIQLAKEYKMRVLENPQIASRGIPQKAVAFADLTFPRTVCTAAKCCRVTGEGMDRKVEYISICHDRCYLTGVEQEKIADPSIRECEVMNPDTGSCTKCHCRWRLHQHITYQCDTHLTYAQPTATSNTTMDKNLSLSDIDQRITALREEQAHIQDVYKKLAQFLQANSLLPVNDSYIEYLQYFIREEQTKQNGTTRDTEVIAHLERMLTEYTSEIELFKKTLKDQNNAGKQTSTLTPAEVFTLSGSLYHLPINGKQIREQVNRIKIGEEKRTNEREKLIELPAKAAGSKVMLQLKEIVF